MGAVLSSRVSWAAWSAWPCRPMVASVARFGRRWTPDRPPRPDRPRIEPSAAPNNDRTHATNISTIRDQTFPPQPSRASATDAGRPSRVL